MGTTTTQQQKYLTVRELFHRVLVQFLIMSGSLHGLSVLGPVYLSKHLGASPSTVGLAASAVSIGALVTSVNAGTFIGLFGYKKSASLGAFIVMLSYLLAGSTGYYSTEPLVYNATIMQGNTLQGNTTTSLNHVELPTDIIVAQVVYCLAAAFIGIGFTFYYLGQHTLISSRVADSSRGKAFAFTGGFWRISGIFFPLIAGGLGASLGLHVALMLFSLVPVVAGVLVLTCWPKVPSSSSSTATAAPTAAAPTTPTPTPATTNAPTQTKPKSCCQIMVEFRSQLFQVGSFSALLSVVRAGRTILIPLVGLSLNLNIVSISVAVTASFVCGVCMFPFSGLIMDRFGRRVNGSISLTIFGCGLVSLGFAQNVESFVASAALCGLGNGFSSGLVMTLGGDLANSFGDEKNRGPFLGVYKLVCDIGGVSGPLIAGVVTNAFDTSVSSFLFAIFAVVALLWLRCVVPETRPPTRPETKSKADTSGMSIDEIGVVTNEEEVHAEIEIVSF